MRNIWFGLVGIMLTATSAAQAQGTTPRTDGVVKPSNSGVVKPGSVVDPGMPVIKPKLPPSGMTVIKPKPTTPGGSVVVPK